MAGELKVNVDIDDKTHKIMIRLSDIAEWKVHVCVGGRGGTVCVCVCVCVCSVHVCVC